MSVRAETWIRLLASAAKSATCTASNGVLWCDAALGNSQVRYVAVVPDPKNPFPRARSGEVGLLQAWTLARCIRQVITPDSAAQRDGKAKGGGQARRAIVALVDVPSQAYGRREEALCLSLAIAGAVDAYAEARRAGHPSVALILGKALSGGFLAHGYQASRLLALDVPDVQIQAMGKEAAAKITRRSLAELEAATSATAAMAYDLDAFAQLGILDERIPCSNADAPGAADVTLVRERLTAAIQAAESDGPHLAPRLDRGRPDGSTLSGTRELSHRVRQLMKEEWLAP